MHALFYFRYLLVYIGEKQDSWHGYAYASAYAFSQLVGGMLNAHAAYLMALGGYKVQSALTSALYKKVNLYCYFRH